MNGHALPDLSTSRPVNSEAVRVLEALLAEARAGQVASVAVVYSYGPGHATVTMNTQLPLELNLGCDMLKATLLGYMTKPAASRIVRAVPGG